MRKMVLGIAAGAIVAAGIVMLAPAQSAQIHHGWDGRWHDWWHSGWDFGRDWIHHDCRVTMRAEQPPDGRATAFTVDCSRG
jgi:hypothetical protein